MIAIGTALTAAGLAALVYCITVAWRARRAGLDDAAMRLRLRHVLVVNLAALGASALGLMLVVAGITLG
jgi:hypothetical protein